MLENRASDSSKKSVLHICNASCDGLRKCSKIQRLAAQTSKSRHKLAKADNTASELPKLMTHDGILHSTALWAHYARTKYNTFIHAIASSKMRRKVCQL